MLNSTRCLVTEPATVHRGRGAAYSAVTFVGEPPVGLPPTCRQTTASRWWGEIGLPVTVALCPSAVERPPREQAGPARAAVCVPAIYGKLPADGGKSPTPDDILQHHRRNQNLGFAHTYVYVANSSWRLPPPAPPGLTLLYTPWVDGMRVATRGQVWQNNDCLHRAAADGFDWVLLADADELLSVPVDEVLSAQDESVDVVSIGLQQVHNRTAAGVAAAQPSCNSVPLFDLWLRRHKWGLFDWLGISEQVCLGGNGRRKNLVRTKRAWACHNHWCLKCVRGPCVVNNTRLDDVSLYEHRKEWFPTHSWEARHQINYAFWRGVDMSRPSQARTGQAPPRCPREAWTPPRPAAWKLTNGVGEPSDLSFFLTLMFNSLVNLLAVPATLFAAFFLPAALSASLLWACLARLARARKAGPAWEALSQFPPGAAPGSLR